MAVSTTDTGKIWKMTRRRASTPLPSTNQSSITAGRHAQYGANIGTAAKTAANAENIDKYQCCILCQVFKL